MAAYVLDRISFKSSYIEKCILQYCGGNQNAHFKFNNFFFRKSCHLLEKYCSAVCATEGKITTNTHTEYVILNVFVLQQWLHERALVLRYMCSTVQHSTAQHSTAQHSTVQHSTAQHSTAQHSTAQYSTVQYSTHITLRCFDARH